jgi:predicted nucleic acid-binding protein
MRIFLDANILVSVLNHEYPVFTYASRVLSLANNPGYQVYTSPICLAIAFYFAEKKSGTAAAKKKMMILAEKLQIALVDDDVVKKAANDKTVLDFEDGLEYYAAVQAKCQCIVTEDGSDFHFSKMEIMTAVQFLEKYVMK